MRFGRWRRGGGGRTPSLSDAAARFREPERGPTIVLERLDPPRGGEIIAALRKRYEVTDPDGRGVEVLVGDAVYPDEAVVRLASIMDEIDPDWQWLISWPKAKQ